MRDRSGRLAVVSWPNPALAVWLATVVIGWSGAVPEDRTETLRDIGTGALIVWGLDELLRGASPVRRVLGAVVLGAQLVRLLG